MALQKIRGNSKVVGSLFRNGITRGKFIVLLIVVVLIVAFLIASSIWNIWRNHKYNPFAEGMKHATSTTGTVPRFSLEKNGDIYYVKYPDYLSTTGNLAIKPTDASELDSLIIWPQANGGFKYGVILNDGGTTYQVYINQDGKTALYEDDQWLVDGHMVIIQQYLKKANAMWDLSQ